MLAGKIFDLRLVKDERVAAGKMEQNMKASREENSLSQQKKSDCKENEIFATARSIMACIFKETRFDLMGMYWVI